VLLVSSAIVAPLVSQDSSAHPVITKEVEVRARHVDAPTPIHWAANSSFISVAELGVPANAASEFVKANRLMAKQDWKKAVERLRKGLAIYPNYAEAYNDLGAVYSLLGEIAQARDALRQAIVLDDRFGPAYVNLGSLSFLDKDYPGAESLLTRATSLRPAADADELFLLAYAQLMDHHLDQAIETTRQGHPKFSHHACLHLVAANAYERQAKIADSMSELRLYLTEEPTGPFAEETRKALAIFEAQTTSQTAARWDLRFAGLVLCVAKSRLCWEQRQ
jgi:tetratricopeptide (TPR) repeat protein